MSLNKTIYFMWEGETLPFLRFMSVYSFYKLNPEWEVVFVHKKSKGICEWKTGENPTYVDDNSNDCYEELFSLPIKVLDFENDFEHIQKLNPHMSCVHAKDILNWYILAHWGGVVSDMDILYTKSIDKLYEEFIQSGAETGLISFNGYPKKDYIPVSFMLGGPSKFFQDTYKNAINRYKPSIYECVGSDALACQTLHEIRAVYGEESVFKINESYLFPFTDVKLGDAYELIHNKNSKHKIPDTTIGIHWYGANAGSASATKLNYRELNNTISNLIDY